MGSEQVAAVLRQSGSHVRLVVARPVEPTSPDYQVSEAEVINLLLLYLLLNSHIIPSNAAITLTQFFRSFF